MKSFTAITLVVLLCCLEVALSYPNPAAKPKLRPFSLPGEHFQETGGKPQTFGERPQERKSHFENLATSQTSKY